MSRAPRQRRGDGAAAALTRLPARRGGALLVRGEEGVGKTPLVERARGVDACARALVEDGDADALYREAIVRLKGPRQARAQYHLHKVFSKLGIGSRVQLGHALSADDA